MVGRRERKNERTMVPHPRSVQSKWEGGSRLKATRRSRDRRRGRRGGGRRRGRERGGGFVPRGGGRRGGGWDIRRGRGRGG